MSNLCIIPARGGSKRIPRKNIREFHGKPIIAYSIEAALNSGLFDEVMVSTDDKEIAEIAVNHGAVVPFMRSFFNSNDFATTTDVIAEVISRYKEEGRFFNYACCCYATAPFVDSIKLIEGFKALTNESAATVFPVVEFDFPIWRSLKLSDKNKVEMNWPEFINSRSQDLPKSFHDAGQWYWLDINKFEKEKRLYCENSIGIILEKDNVQDIDNEIDWKLAEIKFQIKNQN